jgi:hypothetical protein
MIYNIDNISLFANHFYRSRRQDNRPYICRKYRIQPYSKKVREELRFRRELKSKESLRIEQELQEFREQWFDDIRRINEMFEAGEDDLIFPTKHCCECGNNHSFDPSPAHDSFFPTKQYPQSGKNRGFDTSQPLWGLDYLLRNQENHKEGTANGK